MSTNEKKKEKNDRSILIEFYKTQWELIHDLNRLDWRVALIFIPLMGSVAFIFGIALQSKIQEIYEFTEAIRAMSFVAYLICIYGLWTVTKGHAHAKMKFDTLKGIEEDLKFDHYIYHRKNDYFGKKFWGAIISRRSILFIIYFSSGLLSYLFASTPIPTFSWNNLFRLDVLLITPILTSVILVLQYQDYRIHVQKTEEVKQVAKRENVVEGNKIRNNMGWLVLGVLIGGLMGIVTDLWVEYYMKWVETTNQNPDWTFAFTLSSVSVVVAVIFLYIFAAKLIRKN